MVNIPKKINYCWFGNGELPELAKKCIASWRKYCPEYEIVRWDESNFNVNICDYTKEAYSRKKWAFVSDYARFWILYNFGGIYFDTDVELIKPIDDIVSSGAFMAYEKNSQKKSEMINPGLGLASEAGNFIYREILKYYNTQHFIMDDGRDNTTTVVKRVSDILQKYEIERTDNEKIARVGNIYLYPSEYFCPIDYFTGDCTISDNTRSIHHYVASWMSEEEKKNAEIFTELKKKYGKFWGRFLGYFGTLKIRANLYGWKNAVLLRRR